MAQLKFINYIDFLRDIGVNFSVNKMLATDIYKNRLEDGLTYFEFSYILLQSYDFLELYRRADEALYRVKNEQKNGIAVYAFS